MAPRRTEVVSHKHKTGLIIIFLVLITGVQVIESLLCYQCGDTSKDGGMCQNDVKGLVNSREGDPDAEPEIFPKDGRYTKNCSSSSTVNNPLDYCVIETYASQGSYKSFIRDCSDGVVFSFNGELKDLHKLENVKPDNETTCIYRLATNVHICVTLCRTDFCNGPQIIPNETANCTDNTTCSAPGIWKGSNSVWGAVFFHPLVLPLVIYFVSVIITS